MVGVTLAGCGSAGTAAKTSSAPVKTSTPAKAAATAPTATTAQYASIVAKEKVGMDKSLDELLGPNCDWTTPGAVDVRSGYITCAAGSLGIGYQAKSLSLELSGAQSPKATKMYIGKPPPEIALLVKDTRAAADALGKASSDAQDCTTSTGTGCRHKLFTFSTAMTAMQSQLAAWKPYGA